MTFPKTEVLQDPKWVGGGGHGVSHNQHQRESKKSQSKSKKISTFDSKIENLWCALSDVWRNQAFLPEAACRSKVVRNKPTFTPGPHSQLITPPKTRKCGFERRQAPSTNSICFPKHSTHSVPSRLLVQPPPRGLNNFPGRLH